MKAVSFAYGIPPVDAIPILEERIKNLEDILDHVKQEYDNLKKINGYSGMIITKAGIKHIEIEIETVKEFIELLRTRPNFYIKDMPNMLKEMLKYKEQENNHSKTKIPQSR
jgi:phosphopantetheine adenylyltransferase